MKGAEEGHPIKQGDPRFLYIRLINAKLKPEYNFKSGKAKLKMQLASKFSSTSFSLEDFEGSNSRIKK